ncbi:hypothetical protein GGF37_005402, partial [Kickxella alabastrina]
MSTSVRQRGSSGSKGKVTAKVEKTDKPAKQTKAANSDSELSGSDNGDSDNGDSDNGNSSDASDYDDLAKARKQAHKAIGSRKRKTADAEEFSTILSSILGQDARNESAPIMAKDKTRENQLKEELLDYRARKALAAERRMQRDKDRVVPSMVGFDYERKLRKVATKGVIKLFNVVKAQQTELTEINSVQTMGTEK